LLETQEIEYKDFSKSRSLNKKSIVSKFFKEISAFANSEGGKIIVGKEDKTGKSNVQPEKIIEWLENDFLTSEINRISDNLIVFKSEEDKGIITIIIQESDDPISANIDYKGINKGDCFIRENHQAKHAKGNTLKNLITRKSISIDNRLKQLRKILHHKYSTGKSSVNKLNIFDSLVISMESEDPYISTLFDKFMKHQFICSYHLPISRFTTLQMHIKIVDSIIKNAKQNHSSSIILKREAFHDLEKNPTHLESFFSCHRDNVLNSIQLKNYILENKSVIE